MFAQGAQPESPPPAQGCGQLELGPRPVDFEQVYGPWRLRDPVVVIDQPAIGLGPCRVGFCVTRQRARPVRRIRGGTGCCGLRGDDGPADAVLGREPSVCWGSGCSQPKLASRGQTTSGNARAEDAGAQTCATRTESKSICRILTPSRHKSHFIKCPPFLNPMSHRQLESSDWAASWLARAARAPRPRERNQSRRMASAARLARVLWSGRTLPGPGRVHAIGKEHPESIRERIDPKAHAGKAGMTIRT